MNIFKKLSLAFAASAFLGGAAFAQTQTLDQIPVPVPGSGNTTSTSENLIQSFTVPGGALYQTFYRQPGPANNIMPGGVAFVPGGTGSAISRFQNLTDGHSDLGVPLTAT